MNLTKEAKIFLATKVDNWKEAHGGLYKPGVTIFYDTYNPHEIQGAEYLKGIIDGIKGELRYWLVEKYPVYINSSPKSIENYLEKVLECHGYTGKVWV